MAEMIWKNEKRKVSDLRDHSQNPRQFTEKGMADLRKSIEQCGYVEPIAINTNGTILSGHARKKILQEAGLTEVDVRVPERELTEAEEREVLVRMNKNTAGEFNFEILANEFEIEELREFGFTDLDLQINSEPKERQIIDDGAEWMIIVSFSGENETRQLFEELQKRGYECKIMK
jgi:hypothetical protein